MEESFGLGASRGFDRFLSAENVLRPNNHTPQAVFDVRFRSDRTSIEPLAREQLQKLGGLFAAPFHRKHVNATSRSLFQSAVTRLWSRG